MKRWLNSSGYTAPEGDLTTKLNAFTGKIEPISMTWLLNPANDTRRVTKTAYNKLFISAELNYFLSEKVRIQWKKNLSRELSGKIMVEFGDFLAAGKALNDQSIQHIAVKGNRLTIDQLAGAMGDFQLNAVPKSKALKNGDEVTVTIDDVGINAIDSYDFLGSQSLGCWKRPDSVTPGFVCASDEYRATNDRFNKFRSVTGKGGDFMIMSDVKSGNLTSPVRCTFQVSDPKGQPMNCSAITTERI